MRTTFCDLMIGCAELRGDNAALLFGADGPMLAPFYDIASTEIYGETRPRPIVIGDDVPPAPLLIDIRHTIELCGLEFQPTLIEVGRADGPALRRPRRTSPSGPRRRAGTGARSMTACSSR